MSWREVKLGGEQRKRHRILLEDCCAEQSVFRVYKSLGGNAMGRRLKVDDGRAEGWKIGRPE
jgi:hypothetical protein